MYMSASGNSFVVWSGAKRIVKLTRIKPHGHKYGPGCKLSSPVEWIFTIRDADERVYTFKLASDRFIPAVSMENLRLHLPEIHWAGTGGLGPRPALGIASLRAIPD
jgi:hypothetical protein